MNEIYLKELLKCVKCGGCKADCPTYDNDETESMAARGRLILLRELLLKRLKPSPELNDMIFSCLLCGACSNLCPSNVDITEQIYKGRRVLKRSDKKRKLHRILTRAFIKSPSLSYKILQSLGHFISPYLSKKGFIPSNFNIPEAPFRVTQQVYKPSDPIGRVAIFTGCSINYFYPSLGVSLINILLKAGYEVIVPSGEVCCGVPMRTLGLEEEAKAAAKKNLRIFNKLKVEAVLSLCPTCIVAIKKHYPKLVGEAIKNAEDASTFLLKKLDLKKISPIKKHPLTFTYHDPCHMIHELGIKNEPREILKTIGLSLTETEEKGCCGFGGTFSLSFEDISKKMLDKQIKNYKKTGAHSIITSCPGCMMQFSKVSDKMPVFHIIELIEEAYCGSDAL
ncbi:MAG: (Fe-S)-binding protein [Nitrospiraceae bacterium]|nr:(Fe-S)-binding protein [Nitrospiraceae bacterium]